MMKTQNISTYQTLPDTARAWVYQSSRVLSDNEVAEIKELTAAFLSTWNAHGAELDAAYLLKYNTFLVLFVNEEQAGASGCSIDKSMQFVLSLENKYGVEFTNRLKLAYIVDDKIVIEPMSDITAKISSGIIDENTIVFNNLVQTKGEFENNWQVPLKNSWHKQMLN